MTIIGKILWTTMFRIFCSKKFSIKILKKQKTFALQINYNFLKINNIQITAHLKFLRNSHFHEKILHLKFKRKSRENLNKPKKKKINGDF